MKIDKQVAFCIIENPENGKILFLERVKDPQGWSLPGGKFDENESPEEAMVREVFEETGLIILRNGARYLGAIKLKKSKIGHVFHVYSKEFKPVLSEGEHKKFMWVKNWDKINLAGKVGTMLGLLNKKYEQS